MRLAASFLGVVIAVMLTIAMLFTAGWTHPPVSGKQNAYRGLAMVQLTTPGAEARLKQANELPEAIAPVAAGGERATDVYKNVQVLTDLSADQFNRVMAAITEWVAPNQGCAYCHNVDNMADDSIYAKKVARRMLKMTSHINIDWKSHVADTGVVCYTCHRGNPVPAYLWFDNPGWPHAGGFTASNDGMGHPNSVNGSTGLPQDPLAPLLDHAGVIRVQATEALSKGFGAPIQATEQTYSLMISMSNGLGVNCTFCHNTRDFGQWPESTPQRVVAWHGIQMVRDLNENYLDPLKELLPENRLGVLGDGPKITCATCHQGASRPLLGASIAKDFPELGGSAPK